MKKSKIFSLLLATTIILTSCTGQQGDTTSSSKTPEQNSTLEPQVKNTLIIGTTAGIEKPSRSDYYFDVLSGTVSQLAPVYIKENGEYMPMLTDFETTDSKTWTLTINDDYKWSDGTPITSEDIDFTLEFLDNGNKGKFLSMYETINIIDEKRIQLVLKEANVRYLSNLTTIRIIPKHIYKDIEKAEGDNEAAVKISSGIFKYKGFNKNAGTIEFEKNPYYPNNNTALENVIFKLYSNEDTMSMALIKSDIDMIYTYAGGVSGSQLPVLAKSEHITLTPINDTSNTAVLVFNNNIPPFNNESLRKAVYLAVDYEKFRELFGTRYSVKSTKGFAPKGTLGYVETPENIKDIEGSKKILADMGGVDTDNDGILEIDGKPISFELLIRNDKPIYLRYGQLLKENLKQVGIDVILKETDVAQFRTITEKEHTNHATITKFTAFGMGMGGGLGSAYLDSRELSTGQGQVSDVDFHQIVDSLKSAKTTEEYLEAAQQCQAFYANQIPAVSIYLDSYITPYLSNIEGFVIDGTFGLLNMETLKNIKIN